MFSFSSTSNGDDSDCLGAHSHSGFLNSSSSSFKRLVSSSSPAFLEEDDDDQFRLVTANFFAMSSQVQQPAFLLRHDDDQGNPDLIDNPNFVQMSYDNIVMEGEGGLVGKNHQSKASLGGSSHAEICEKNCQAVVLKRPAAAANKKKKDRHSKISTARGPRDRRMRLSLQVARKFFDLQDKLGFDKASKTIEWLFTMSKNAIREVMGEPAAGISCTMVENGRWRNHEYAFEHSSINHKHCRSTSKKKLRRTHYVANWPQVTKDDRDKARAWARERTVEKMRLKKALKDPIQGSSSLLATSEKTATANNNYNPRYHHTYSTEQISSCNAIEHVDSYGAKSQSVEELIHAGWEEIEDASRFYSASYYIHGNSI